MNENESSSIGDTLPQYPGPFDERTNDEHPRPRVEIFTLSYCEPCKKVKKYLDQLDVEYRSIEIDTCSLKERQRALTVFGSDLPSGGIRIAYPLIVIDGCGLIMGFDEGKISEALSAKISIL